MAVDEATIRRAEQLIEYGKLYLQRKAEGLRPMDLTPVEKTKVFKYMVARRMYLLSPREEPEMTDEEFIADREERLKRLREELKNE